MLVEHKGRLIPIEEPINLAKRRPTPHPSQVIDLTDDSDVMVPVSSARQLTRSGILERRSRSRHEMKRVR